MAAEWKEVRGTRVINTSGETFADVQIDFEAAVATEVPEHGATYSDGGFDSLSSLIPKPLDSTTCTEPEIVQIRRHHRATPTKSRITVLFRGTLKGA